MLANLGVHLEGSEDLKLVLATLKISIQKKVIASAVRSAAGPVARDLRKQLRAISRASPVGTFTLARNIGTKILRQKKGLPKIVALVGPKTKVQGPALDSIKRKTPPRRAKPLPSQTDEGARATLANLRKAQGKKSGTVEFRVPSRYFHFIERGFTNWQTGRRIPPKAPMRIAARRQTSESIRRFRFTAQRGIIRESLRASRYSRPQTLKGQTGSK